MAPIKCFLLVPTKKCKRSLRRYSRGYGEPTETQCPNKSYHDAMIWFETVEEIYDGQSMKRIGGSPAPPPHWDPRWPSVCGCGFIFTEEHEYQVFEETIWKRVDTGEEMSLRDAPDGAMWDAFWFHDAPGWCGPDGKCMVCKVPFGHEWMIDGPAKNCTRKGERHWCWVRHGEPPNLTVDKNGNTCSAGAGSIAAPKWHGFLRNGFLVP